MAESMAEAAMKNPKKFPNAAAQIAEMTERLPPAAKGDLIAKIDQTFQKTNLNKTSFDESLLPAKLPTRYANAHKKLQKPQELTRPKMRSRKSNQLPARLHVPDQLPIRLSNNWIIDSKPP